MLASGFIFDLALVELAEDVLIVDEDEFSLPPPQLNIK
jgi:hypothetical protein